jgi:hypothetical protein
MRDECLFARFFVVRIAQKQPAIQLFETHRHTERNIPKALLKQARTRAKKRKKNRQLTGGSERERGRRQRKRKRKRKKKLKSSQLVCPHRNKKKSR